MNRFFEIVPDEFRKVEDPIMPIRSTKSSAGYDFIAPFDFSLKANEVNLIWTDIRIRIEEDEVLNIYPRSSLGVKYGIELANEIGVIDSDYFQNEKTGGNIGIPLIFRPHRNHNFSKITFKRGDKLVQGIIYNYLIADNCNSNEERTGGFGSTK